MVCYRGEGRGGGIEERGGREGWREVMEVGRGRGEMVEGNRGWKEGGQR